jgi:magnesium-transporting ATPase (P-type)
VHGARSYRRISLLILYSFYKNFCVALSNILFAFYSAFAGQLFYDALCGSLFNLFFTALPIMGAAVFNAHVRFVPGTDTFSVENVENSTSPPYHFADTILSI